MATIVYHFLSPDNTLEHVESIMSVYKDAFDKKETGILVLDSDTQIVSLDIESGNVTFLNPFASTEPIFAGGVDSWDLDDVVNTTSSEDNTYVSADYFPQPLESGCQDCGCCAEIDPYILSPEELQMWAGKLQHIQDQVIGLEYGTGRLVKEIDPLIGYTLTGLPVYESEKDKHITILPERTFRAEQLFPGEDCAQYGLTAGKLEIALDELIAAGLLTYKEAHPILSKILEKTGNR